MMAEKMVPMMKDGQSVSLAVTPHDFFTRKLSRKDEHEMETYADAGYRLGDRYENGDPYDGPKTKQAYDKEQSEKKAAKAKDAPDKPKDAADAAPADAVSVTVAGDAGPSKMGDGKKS